MQSQILSIGFDYSQKELTIFFLKAQNMRSWNEDHPMGRFYKSLMNEWSNLDNYTEEI